MLMFSKPMYFMLQTWNKTLKFLPLLWCELNQVLSFMTHPISTTASVFSAYWYTPIMATINHHYHLYFLLSQLCVAALSYDKWHCHMCADYTATKGELIQVLHLCYQAIPTSFVRSVCLPLILSLSVNRVSALYLCPDVFTIMVFSINHIIFS